MPIRAIAPIVGKSQRSLINDLKISGDQELITSEPEQSLAAGPLTEHLTVQHGAEWVGQGEEIQS